MYCFQTILECSNKIQTKQCLLQTYLVFQKVYRRTWIIFNSPFRGRSPRIHCLFTTHIKSFFIIHVLRCVVFKVIIIHLSNTNFTMSSTNLSSLSKAILENLPISFLILLITVPILFIPIYIYTFRNESQFDFSVSIYSQYTLNILSIYFQYTLNILSIYSQSKTLNKLVIIFHRNRSPRDTS